MSAKPTGLVTISIPGLGKIALPKMSPAAKSRATIERLGTSKLRNGITDEEEGECDGEVLPSAPGGVGIACE